MFVLIIQKFFPIDCLWLQLCIGSHGHVCDLGLSAMQCVCGFTNDYYNLCCASLYYSYGTSCGTSF